MAGCSAHPNLAAEDGSRLWLRYAPLANPRDIREFVVEGNSPTMTIIRDELALSLPALLGRTIASSDAVSLDGAIVVKTARNQELESLGDEGFIIRSSAIDGRNAIVISSMSDRGALYGTFHFLRLLQTGRGVADFDIAQRPLLQRRLLNHWDNLDGSIERGYAGKSLWQWDDLPHKLSPRYAMYARACASIGINGAVLNNVNAKPQSLSAVYLRKTAALADVFRPYGIRVYLSANFAAPKTLGKLDTADPLDPRVAAWWLDKAAEIYALIPDFGGFVVKANSEGQPGPQDYRRTHADGANVLADALAPHGGIVMWRAFVYNENVDPDRAKRAYIEFTALDGRFRPNVIVQVKNGPIDFMPREPFHPIFGAMRNTPVMAELQITQEYLGHSNHLVYLAPMWKEFLDADTFARGEGTPVASTISAIAGVANTGSDANWTGHHFAQANWYAFGRLAWDHRVSAEQVADEWIAQTFTRDRDASATIHNMMLSSWQTFINYTMPLGLHHLIGGDHYAVQPWNDTAPRADWTATYYHRADNRGIGFDRSRTGSAACDQYFPRLRDRFADPATCPEELLLWFHHLPWTHRISSGRTLWDELCFTYNAGFESAQRMRDTWQSLRYAIDPQRHREIAAKLEIQTTDARTWRDQCVSYFQRFSKMPIESWATPLNSLPPLE